MIINPISKRIKDLRTDKEKTQQEVADYLNIERKTYLRYEKGEHEIRINIIVKLAEYYNVSIDYILGLTDKEKPFKSNDTLTKEEQKVLRAYKKDQDIKEAIDRIIKIQERR